MGIHQNKNGLFSMCDNGLLRLSKCASFDCRQIIYVDKKATGTGDGSSWGNAYTSIQTAINAQPCKEIQIKGYGENDCYPAGIPLIDCVYLKGVNTGSGDMWIDGENSYIRGIDGKNLTSTRLENINIKGCKYSNFINCYELISCNTKDTYLKSQWGSFFYCVLLNNCEADSIYGDDAFKNCKTMIDCTSKNSSFGFWNSVSFGPYDLINCKAINNFYTSFTGRPGSTFTGCVADGNLNYAFSTNGCTYIDCIAINNQWCGYRHDYIENTYINCTDSNNCLAWGGDCSQYDCDTV